MPESKDDILQARNIYYHMVKEQTTTVITGQKSDINTTDGIESLEVFFFFFHSFSFLFLQELTRYKLNTSE